MLDDWTESTLALLRAEWPTWDLWTVRGIYPKPSTTWCARPKGSPVATVNAGSPEELVAEIAEQESAT